MLRRSLSARTLASRISEGGEYNSSKRSIELVTVVTDDISASTSLYIPIHH